jgi:nitroreductase
MDLAEAILTRRTIKDFRPDVVPADLLDRALSAGLWAQNHKLTQPWRFAILGPETRRALAAAAGENGPLVLSKPAIVAVSCALSGDAHQRWEDELAVACAIQNIQLTAWSAGFGMQWSSGKLLRLEGVHALLGLDPAAEKLMGLLFFGFPARTPAPAPRKPLAEVLRRLP